MPCSVSVTHENSHRHTSAFRFNHTYTYPTEFFFYNESNPDSTSFFPVENFTVNASIVNDMGMVLFDLDEKTADISVIPKLYMNLTNEVRQSLQYEVTFEGVYHNLPYGLEGGRNYSYSGTIRYNIKTIQLEIDHTTSNVLTPGQNLQVQEKIFANVTVTFIEVILKHFWMG